MSKLSVIQSVGRFGNVWHLVVDQNGELVDSGVYAEGERDRAEAHARTGRHHQPEAAPLAFR